MSAVLRNLLVPLLAFGTSSVALAKPGKQNPSDTLTTQSLLDAMFLEARGDAAGAATLYWKLASAPQVPARGQQLARRRSIELILNDPSAETAAAEMLLDSGAAGDDPQQLWNWECRLLLNKIAAAPPGSRREIWSAGLKRPKRERLRINDEVFQRLPDPGVPMTIKNWRPSSAMNRSRHHFISA